jgi:long-chain acyl-CoA synthetase
VVIVPKPGETLDEAGLRAHCAEVMAKHKIPRYIWFQTEALPRNASGKFLKRELRDRLSAELKSS